MFKVKVKLNVKVKVKNLLLLHVLKNNKKKYAYNFITPSNISHISGMILLLLLARYFFDCNNNDFFLHTRLLYGYRTVAIQL